MAATGTMTVRREQALAFRARRQQLASPAGRVDAAAALGLGLQDTPRGSALLALRARVAAAPERVGRALDGGSLVLALTVRGAPHVVARRDLPLLTAALRPDDGDGVGREAADGELVADAMRDVLGAAPSVTRPSLSEGLNARVPDRLRSWCERCEARHVPEGLFRRATLWAGLVVDPEGSPTRFVRADAGLGDAGPGEAAAAIACRTPPGPGPSSSAGSPGSPVRPGPTNSPGGWTWTGPGPGPGGRSWPTSWCGWTWTGSGRGRWRRTRAS